MKVRTILIYRGEYKFVSQAEKGTTDELAALKALYSDRTNDIDSLTFTDDDGVWYCFPRKVLDECVICVEVLEEEE